MKKSQIIKTIVFCTLGVLILIFNNQLVEYANYLVGSLMIIYGIEDSIIKISSHLVKDETPKCLDDLLIVVLGVILLFLNQDKHFVPLCIIWATWAILREEWEISEVIHEYKVLGVKIVNILESIAVIVISILFIFSPTEHHVHIHIVVLGFELILEVMFPLIEKIFEKLLHKDHEKLKEQC